MLLWIAGSLPAIAAEPGPARWAAILDRTVPAVVAIRVAATRPFDTEPASVSSATGFVVDREKGLILTNRHVVSPGPVTAEAVFLNHEKVDIEPIYRDPVHDFGFFRYDPEEVRFMDAVEIPLDADGARVGREIRVIGNDAGEKLSILAGTIARLDRDAPHYGRDRYNDFNTFYYQAASGTSGGSSGSPVIDRTGRAVALNAAANRRAASSFFLPLYRVVRALDLLRAGEPVTRGTLQTVFVHAPYDELRRLGFPPDLEEQARRVHPERSGLLVVRETVTGSPARELLEPGDVLLTIDGEPATEFRAVEELLDERVGATVSLELVRGGERLVLELPVDDLHALTPSEYLEFSGGILHALSFQQARNHAVPPGGVYVASEGYALSRGGLPSRSIITAVDGEEVTDLDHFESLVAGRYDGERVAFRYFHLSNPRAPQVALVTIDRRWFPMQRCRRNDGSGAWPCTASLDPPPTPTARVESTRFPSEVPKVARRLVRSLVFVEFHIPFKIDGVQGVAFSGTGLVVDAERGLVAVDRDTVPVMLGDLRLTFAKSASVEAEVVAIHPEHNVAIVRYDPSRLGDTPIESARLLPERLRAGKQVWLVGLTPRDQVVARKTEIERVEPVALPLPNPPRFRESNLEIATLSDVTPTVGGVLCDRRGRVLALWASFSTDRNGKPDSFFAGLPVDVVRGMLAPLQQGRRFVWRTLGVEFGSVPLADARARGLSDDHFERIDRHDPIRRHVLSVRRIAHGVPAGEALSAGDLLISVEGAPATSFREVERYAQSAVVNALVLRDGDVVATRVPTVEVAASDTERVLVWSGAILQDPPRDLATQRGLPRSGVYVAARFRGSPAERHGLQPTRRILAVNGQPVEDLEAFWTAVAPTRDRGSVRLRTLDLDGQPRVRTLELDLKFWPTFAIERSGPGGSWRRRPLVAPGDDG